MSLMCRSARISSPPRRELLGDVSTSLMFVTLLATGDGREERAAAVLLAVEVAGDRDAARARLGWGS